MSDSSSAASAVSAKICALCGIPAKLKCVRCMKTYYCSQTCQKEHWKVHKPQCVEVPKYVAPPDEERCKVCKGWGKGLITRQDGLCEHCHFVSTGQTFSKSE